MVGCSVYGCNSRSEKRVPGLTFHRLPMNDPKRRALWTQKMRREADWVPTNNDRICSKHFEESMFFPIVGTRKCLLNTAVPTIFEELPEHIQEFLEFKQDIMKRCRQEINSINELPSMTCNEQVAGPSRVNQQQSPKKSLRKELVVTLKRNGVKTQNIKVLSEKLRRYKANIESLQQLFKEVGHKKSYSPGQVKFIRQSS